MRVGGFTEPDVNKINLGCGEDKRDGFINVDIREEVNPDIVCDIRDIPIGEECVNHIFCKDVLEHFWRPKEVIKECNRILVRGGTMEAIVPDWDVLGKPTYWENIDHEQVEKHVYGGHKNPHDQHHTMWTDELAEKRFDESGFNDIEITHLRDRPLHWHMKIETEK